MSKFSPLELRWDPEAGEWELAEPLTYRHVGGEITVPKGFRTDLDSVPRWLPMAHAVLKGRARASAVVHDYLYSKRIDRSRADRIFLDAMRDEGVPAWQRYPIYWGVRVGGWVFYRDHDESRA